MPAGSKDRDRRMKKRKTLIRLIILMLILVCAATAWIIHKGKADNAAEQAEQEEAAQVQEEMGKAEEEAIAKQEAEDAEVASHVISFRGREGENEHSFKAYDEAIKAGSRCISVDIVVSSDKVLYVSSEENAFAMTGYNGMYEYVSSETVDGLKTAAGNKVLRLSEVFDKYGDSISYVIELKANSDACIMAFEQMVEDYKLSDNIIVASRDADTLQIIENKFPDMPKLLVCWNQGVFNYGVEESYVDMLSVRATVETGIWTESNCKAAHDADKLFGVWTIDTEDEIRKAIDMGVDNYFTNETERALTLEKEYGLKVRN